MIAVTGANGQLGQLVIQHLIRLAGAEQIVALVRNPANAGALEELGVTVRQADYSRPETLNSALQGVSRLLLISSSEVGQRAPQHANVINAAVAAGVSEIAYTSLLHADQSPLGLAAEHVSTEAALKASGLKYALLRNGWYTENYLASVAPALAAGSFIGSAGEGRISSAARNDYAEAAAVVMADSAAFSNQTYELSGDESYTLAELSQIISEESGKTIGYTDLPEADFTAALEGAGLPGPVAAMLADSDKGASQGGLYDADNGISKLTGHPTASLRDMVKAALA